MKRRLAAIMAADVVGYLDIGTDTKGPSNAPGARQEVQGGVAAAGVEEGSLPGRTPA